MKRFFDIAWRLAMLALPWQTRWIFQPATQGGFPWEQGAVAGYVSWLLLLATVLVGLFHEIKSGSGPWSVVRGPVGSFQRTTNYGLRTLQLAILVLLIVSFFTASPLATALWWLHVVILALFVWTLVRAKADVTPWFILSLVPHAILGVWQFVAQDINGATILGIATQHPWTSGVSVIEHGLYRVLRVYGGFPHPNIFGGWLAVALILLPGLARKSRSNLETLGLAACAALFATVLVLTFSRGAWIAAVLGIAFAGWFALRSTSTDQDRQATWLVLAAILVSLAAGLASQWDHVTARFTPSERLERWSIEQRSYALEEGWDAHKRRPLQGWGPGASIPAITITREAKFSSRLTVPPEPPHIVPFVALVEVGVIGGLALTIIAWSLLAPMLRRNRWCVSVPLLSALGVLAFTDHYLWTLWAGQALLAIAILLLISHHETESRG